MSTSTFPRRASLALLTAWAMAGALAAAAAAQDATDKAKDKPKDGAASLPLKKLVMFNAGVAFYEHTGQVDGDAHVDLKFNVGDVNDLLKSMVLQDLGGGKVTTVTYGSKDPITRTLRTFAIDLTKNPTLADLLGQVRGEKVQVETPNLVTGVILGVEKRRQRVKDEVIETTVLNLLTDEGLRSVSLEQVGRIKLLNEKLDAELRQALAVLAAGNATDKKSVTLNFRGDGKRRVRVGYIQESPIWKTSYRLVLRDKEKPLLQGWAIVENQTETDWSDVELTLVSGRPISFLMDLYQPLYLPRPWAKLDLAASLRPQTYEQDMDGKEAMFKKLAEKGDHDGDLATVDVKSISGAGGFDSKGGDSGLGALRGEERQQLRKNLDSLKRITKELEVEDRVKQSVDSLAQAGELGELFQYKIETPVTLARRQSAMLPIVNADVDAEKVLIYNPSVHAKHPLSGLRLTNSTKLHLMQGPITVFDDAAYAGDAQIKDLSPGAKRLVSYAMDLNTEVALKSEEKPEELVSCRIIKGALETTHKYRRSAEYTVKNSAAAAKTVLIEQPQQADWKLIAPAKAEETTRDQYRFAVKAEPGKPTQLTVSEERAASQTVALTNLDIERINLFVQAKVVAKTVKDALSDVIRRKLELADVAAQRKRVGEQIAVIGQEQERIRKNMEQLDRTTDLYKRYVTKFTSQEDKVDQLRTEAERLAAQEDAQRKSLNQFLSQLSLE